jgi:hypothetical protein
MLMVVVTAGMALAVALLSTGMAVAAEGPPPPPPGASASAAPERAPATAAPGRSAAAPESAKCGKTESWGKIRYQVCMEFYCDSGFCDEFPYIGLINTATSPRTVNWNLYYGDQNGTVTLKAGEQRTLYPDGWVLECGHTYDEYLAVKYDSAGWSPWASVSAVLPCVT